MNDDTFDRQALNAAQIGRAPETFTKRDLQQAMFNWVLSGRPHDIDCPCCQSSDKTDITTLDDHAHGRIVYLCFACGHRWAVSSPAHTHRPARTDA